MQIIGDYQLRDVVEWICKYTNEYKVDVDIHIDANKEVSLSVCPTYRDRENNFWNSVATEDWMDAHGLIKGEPQVDCAWK